MAGTRKDTPRPRSRKAQPQSPPRIDTSRVEKVRPRTRGSPPKQTELAPPDASVAQFSFAPATQTTVVTTTTTTTTAFPPFVIAAPKHLKDRDPLTYPLASCPTPDALKHAQFQLKGQVARFDEFPDGDATLQQVFDVHMKITVNCTEANVCRSTMISRKT